MKHGKTFLLPPDGYRLTEVVTNETGHIETDMPEIIAAASEAALAAIEDGVLLVPLETDTFEPHDG